MCSGRVSPEFVWYAFRKGAPVVLVSGCHYVDCHYIDANRSTTRRVDGLWDGPEKAGLDPGRRRRGPRAGGVTSRIRTVSEAKAYR